MKAGHFRPGWVDCARGEAIAAALEGEIGQARSILNNLLTTDLNEQSLLGFATLGRHRRSLCERYLRTTVCLTEIEMLNQDGDILRALPLLEVALQGVPNIKPDYEGLKVVRVQSGSSGEKIVYEGQQFKVEPGDYILELNKLPMRTVSDFTKAVDSMSRESEALLRIKDGASGQVHVASVKLDQHQHVRLGITVEQGGPAIVAQSVEEAVESRARLAYALAVSISEQGPLDGEHLATAREALTQANRSGMCSLYCAAIDAILSLRQTRSEGEQAISKFSQHLDEFASSSQADWISLDDRLPLKIMQGYLNGHDRASAEDCLSIIDRLLEMRHPNASVGKLFLSDLDVPTHSGD